MRSADEIRRVLIHEGHEGHEDRAYQSVRLISTRFVRFVVRKTLAEGYHELCARISEATTCYDTPRRMLAARHAAGHDSVPAARIRRASSLCRRPDLRHTAAVRS